MTWKEFLKPTFGKLAAPIVTFGLTCWWLYAALTAPTFCLDICNSFSARFALLPTPNKIIFLVVPVVVFLISYLISCTTSFLKQKGFLKPTPGKLITPAIAILLTHTLMITSSVLTPGRGSKTVSVSTGLLVTIILFTYILVPLIIALATYFLSCLTAYFVSYHKENKNLVPEPQTKKRPMPIVGGILLLLILFVIGIYSKNINIQPEITEWKTYQTKKTDFQFQYPAELGVPQEHQLSTSVVVEFPGKLSITSGSRYNQDLQRELTFDEVLTESNVSGGEKITVDGRLAIKTPGAIYIRDTENSFVIVEAQMINQGLFEQILATFKFTKPNVMPTSATIADCSQYFKIEGENKSTTGESVFLPFSCMHEIDKTLSPFTFAFDKDGKVVVDSGVSKSLLINQGEGFEIVQYGTDNKDQKVENYAVEFKDTTYDGYLDLRLRTFGGAYNSGSVWFAYNPGKRNYDTNPILDGDDGNFDSTKKTFTSYNKGRRAGDIYTRRTYKLDAGKYVLIAIETQDIVGGLDKCPLVYERTTKELVNGEMKIVKTQKLSEQEALGEIIFCK